MTAPTLRQVVTFPMRPARAMLATLPVVRRLDGISPWRPHVFLRSLLAAEPGSEARAGGVVLVHLMREREHAWSGANAAWDKLFEALDVKLEHLPLPPPDVITGLWRPGLKHLQSFELRREWAGLVSGAASDSAPATPRGRKLTQSGVKL